MQNAFKEGVSEYFEENFSYQIQNKSIVNQKY